MQLDHWNLTESVFNWLNNNLPSNATILELGSGAGTEVLCQRFKVYSVEHDVRWLDKIKNANYIHAPLKRYGNHIQWYDIDFLSGRLPRSYDALIVDGPIGANRPHFIHFINLFKLNQPIIIDDTDRPGLYKMAQAISSLCNRPCVEIIQPTKKAIII